MKFNEKLTELRKKKGFSQEELGNKLDVSRQTVSKWELGETTPEMDKLVTLSQIFNVSLDELVKEKVETNDSSSKNKYKIIISIMGILLIIFIIIIYFVLKDNLSRNDKDISNKLTVDKVREISKKGEDISWEDFKKYNGKEVGSGLRIIYYQIEGIYDLMIGGTSEYEKPMYVRLLLDNDKEKYVDIRNEDIDEFIKETKVIDTYDIPVTNKSEEKK